jgi:putative tryptophan/tyrosine transport system substrate-binding protein
MKRREFLGLAAGAAAAWPLAAQAQQKKGMLRVAWVGFLPRSSPLVATTPRRLAEFGYREDENLVIDYVQVAGSEEAIYAGTRELAARKPDILLAVGPEAALKAAIAYAPTTPIVMLAADYDPVARGYVSSLARPGGRITGLYFQQSELVVKRLQFFKEAIPDLTSAIIFYDAISAEQWRAAEAASGKLALRLSAVDLHDPPYDYGRALAEAPPDNRKNLFVPVSPGLFADAERLAKFALSNRLASIFAAREFVAAGGLMSYGASFEKMTDRMNDKVIQIAQGAKPADLPIEQPTKFQFVINLATARALGIEFSQALLARADDVIE